MALLLESDKDSVTLPDISVDVVDTLSFDDRLDDRTVSTIRRGTLTYRDASAGPVQIDPGAGFGSRVSTPAASHSRPDRRSAFTSWAVHGESSIVEGGATRDLRPTVFAVMLRRPALLAGVGVLLLLVSWPRFAGWSRPQWERAQ